MEYEKKDLGEIIAKGVFKKAEEFRKKNQFKVAEELHLEALKWREELLQRDRVSYLPKVAQSYEALGYLSLEEGVYEEAKRYYQAALLIREEMKGAEVLKEAYTHTNLADIFRREGNYKEAQAHYAKALQLYLDLPTEVFAKLQMKVLSIYNYLGVITLAQNLYEETKDAYMGALTIYQSLVNDDSDEYREELAFKLFELGNLYYNHFRFNRAKEVYLFALELFLYLDDLEPNRYTNLCAEIFQKLGTIYTSQLEYGDALSSYRTALKYYIAMAEELPFKYGVYVARLFSDLAKLKKKEKKKESAQYFHQKALDIYFNLMHYNEAKYALVVASTIIEGVVEYGEHTLNLYQAELILEHYQSEQKGSELLEQIYAIREEYGVLL